MVDDTEKDPILDLRDWRRRRLLTIRALAAAAQAAPRTVLEVEGGRRVPHPGPSGRSRTRSAWPPSR